MFYNDGETEVSVEWYDEISGQWFECNIQPPPGRTPSEHIAMFRRMNDKPVQYRTVTTVYDVKGL